LVTAKINEIFESIQGEGLYVGCKQLFIRFCGCNLKCAYCDTDFVNGKSYSPQELCAFITENFDLSKIHSVSLTGGEPLLSLEFLKEFLPLLYGKTKIYLETNATLAENFEEIKTYVDIVSADIKLMSATGYDTLAIHKNFFESCYGIETFAKIVFDEKITEQEITYCANIGEKYEFPLILQPKMIGENLSVNSEICQKTFDAFLKNYKNVRLIPQVHKFLNIK